MLDLLTLTVDRRTKSLCIAYSLLQGVGVNMRGASWGPQSSSRPHSQQGQRVQQSVAGVRTHFPHFNLSRWWDRSWCIRLCLLSSLNTRFLRLLFLCYSSRIVILFSSMVWLHERPLPCRPYQNKLSFPEKFFRLLWDCDLAGLSLVEGLDSKMTSSACRLVFSTGSSRLSRSCFLQTSSQSLTTRLNSTDASDSRPVSSRL